MGMREVFVLCTRGYMSEEPQRKKKYPAPRLRFIGTRPLLADLAVAAGTP